MTGITSKLNCLKANLSVDKIWILLFVKSLQVEMGYDMCVWALAGGDDNWIPQTLFQTSLVFLSNKDKSQSRFIKDMPECVLSGQQFSHLSANSDN